MSRKRKATLKGRADDSLTLTGAKPAKVAKTVKPTKSAKAAKSGKSLPTIYQQIEERKKLIDQEITSTSVRTTQRLQEIVKEIATCNSRTDVKRFLLLKREREQLLQEQKQAKERKKEVEFKQAVEAVSKAAELGFSTLECINNADLNEIVDEHAIVSTAKQSYVCRICKRPYVYHESDGEMVCREHGIGESFAEAGNESSGYSEKGGPPRGQSDRNTHLNGMLSLFEGQEWTLMPEELIDDFRRVQKLSCLQLNKKITPATVKELQSKMDPCMKAVNRVQITVHLNAVCFPVMTKQGRQMLNVWFEKTRDPFRKHKGERKNMLTYALLLRMKCSEGDMQIFLPFFNNLKNSCSLHNQVGILEKLCREENLQFNSVFD